MKKYLSGAVERLAVQQIESETPSSAMVPWTDCNTVEDVFFDWSDLHRQLPTSEFASLTEYHRSKFEESLAFVGAQDEHAPTIVTTISLKYAWEMSALDQKAQEKSQFEVEGKRYRHLRGPPCQVSSALMAVRTLDRVAQQLTQQGVAVFSYCSDVVILSRDFDEALHHTAAVHKALKSSRLTIDGGSSCLIPRTVVRFANGWNTLDTALMGDATVAKRFLHHSFWYHLKERSLWFCEKIPAREDWNRLFGEYIEAARRLPCFPRCLLATGGECECVEFLQEHLPASAFGGSHATRRAEEPAWGAFECRQFNVPLWRETATPQRKL